MKKFICFLIAGMLAMASASEATYMGGGGVTPSTQGGTGQSTSPDDNILLGNGTLWQLKSIPNCVDTGGNHLNYTASTNTISCGNTSASVSPTYGELYLSEAGVYKAASVTVTDGTITSGSVASVQTINQVYLSVQETGKFKVDFTFTGLAVEPAKFKFVGRYNGSTGHEVEVRIWNYNTSLWDDISATTKDIPSTSGTTDYEYLFNYPANAANYISGGQARVRIEHVSNVTTSHFLHTDYVTVYVKSIPIAVAGTWYAVTGLTAGVSNNITLNGTNGTMTTSSAGKYGISIHMSTSGSENMILYMHVFVNGVAVEKTGLRSKFNATGDTRTVSMGGILDLGASDVITLRATGESSGYIAIEYLNFLVNKIH